MQNVEFKAELIDILLARTLCRRIVATHIETIEQTDTYFKFSNGWLKRQEVDGRPADYIHYRRDNSPHPRLSWFRIYSEAEARSHFRPRDLQPLLVLRKTRERYMHRGTRIHLDILHTVGTYIEFEAMVSSSRNLPTCHKWVESLRETFAPAMGEPVSGSYRDIITRRDRRAVTSLVAP